MPAQIDMNHHDLELTLSDPFLLVQGYVTAACVVVTATFQNLTQFRTARRTVNYVPQVV